MSTKTKTKQTNTYGYINNPSSPDINALREMKATADPSIPYHYAGQKEALENSYQNPLGAYTSPAVRDAIQRGAGKRLSMDEAQATRESQYNADNTNFGRQSTVASMTAPRFAQTGGQTVQSTPFDWMGMLMGGAQAGATAYA